MRAALAVLAAGALAAPAFAEAPPPPTMELPLPSEAPDAAPPSEFVPPPAAPPSRIPELTATIVTIGLAGATAVSIERWNAAHDRRRAAQWEHRTPEEHQANIDATVRWQHRTWGLIAGTFVSAAVTAFLWMRHQSASDFSVQPTDDGTGAGISYGGRF